MSTVIMKLTVPSDWDGQQLKPAGTIGLRQICLNRTNWMAHDQLSSIIIPDGGQIIIRRDGHTIYIERP